MSIAVEFNRCALCQGEMPKRDPWQPGGSVFCESCRALAQREASLHGACLAMSRFLVWVWCEAMAACHGNGDGGSWGWEHRRVALGQAVELGLLRLDWSRP